MSSYAKFRDLEAKTETYKAPNAIAPTAQPHPLMPITSAPIQQRPATPYPPQQHPMHGVNQGQHQGHMQHAAMGPPQGHMGPPQHMHAAMGVVEIETTEQKQQLIQNNSVVVVDIYGNSCGPCKSMHSRYEQLGQKYNRPGVCVLARENYELGISTNLSGVPNIQFFKNGQYLGRDIVGVDLPGIEKRILEMLQ